MLSKLLFRLAGVFLILYISTTSATPAVQPVEARETNDEIHARDAKLEQLHLRFKFPCPYPFAWKERKCMTERGPREWRDVCVYSSPATNFRPINNDQPGFCEENSYCMNDVDESNNRVIRCVTDEGKGRAGDPLVGKGDLKRASPWVGNSQFDQPVTIENDMMAASVAGVVNSIDGKFIVTPNNIIVGKIKGKNIEVCKGDKSDASKARECYPNGKYDLRKGDIINYTWGMTGSQEGELLWGIIPH